jgi:hypothetical protein
MALLSAQGRDLSAGPHKRVHSFGGGFFLVETSEDAPAFDLSLVSMFPMTFLSDGKSLWTRMAATRRVVFV